MNTATSQYIHFFSHFSALKCCVVTCDETTILRIEWGSDEKFPPLHTASEPSAQHLLAWFNAYEHGKWELLPQLRASITTAPTGTPFQIAVWSAIAQIPVGTTRSYGQLATEIAHPSAQRAVGAACGKNPLPILVPCHRVVSSTGIGGFSGDLAVKKELLAHEKAS